MNISYKKTWSWNENLSELHYDVTTVGARVLRQF